jgi:hypothetical protein
MDTLFQLRIPGKIEAELRSRLAKLQAEHQKQILSVDSRMEMLLLKGLEIPQPLLKERQELYTLSKLISMSNLVRLTLLAGVREICSSSSQTLFSDLSSYGVALGRRRRS